MAVDLFMKVQNQTFGGKTTDLKDESERRAGTYYWSKLTGELVFMSNKTGRIAKLSKRIDPKRGANSFHNLRDEDAALDRVRKHMSMMKKKRKKK